MSTPNPASAHHDLNQRDSKDLEAIALLERVVHEDGHAWRPDLSFMARGRSIDADVGRLRSSGAWRGRARMGAVVLVTAATVAGVAVGVSVLGGPGEDRTAASSTSPTGPSASVSPALELPAVTDAGGDIEEAFGPAGVETDQAEFGAIDDGTLWDNSAELSLLMEAHGLRRSQAGLGGAWPEPATMTLHIWWVDGAVPDELLAAIAQDAPDVTVEVHASVTDQPTLAAAIDASGIGDVDGVLSVSVRNDGAGIVVQYDPARFDADPAVLDALQESVGWPIVLLAVNETPASDFTEG